jgi:hypothetical protein
LTAAEEQITEHGPAALIDASNLAVEYRTFDAKVFSDLRGQVCRATECVSVSGDQFAATGLHVRKRSVLEANASQLKVRFKNKYIGFAASNCRYKAGATG